MKKKDKLIEEFERFQLMDEETQLKSIRGGEKKPDTWSQAAVIVEREQVLPPYYLTVRDTVLKAKWVIDDCPVDKDTVPSDTIPPKPLPITIVKNITGFDRGLP